MADIRLKNSKTRRVEPLEPTVVDGKVSMYLCGPTVYDRAHIGNARSAVVFDQLYRLLRHEYGADNVTFVRNFTDVDDKINARAAETGRPIADITAETAQWYLDDMGALGVLEPNHMPRATAYIAEMVAFIKDLIAKDVAYARDGHVLFRVRAYKEYGKLSGRSVDDMIAGARVEVAPYKEDPMDFVLWKPSTDDIPGWDSPWGRGRPGWHIECSAMSHAILGEEFDIHGGGADLLFPHHENEVAQSCAAGHAFARIWMHNEMLQVEGKKMSKSLGNFFTVRDLLEGRGPGGQIVPGEVIRFVMLSTHYGKPMDWTEKKVAEARAHLNKWQAPLAGHIGSEDVDPRVVEALASDLNTSKAISVLHQLWKSGNPEDLHLLAGSLKLLGIDPSFPSLDPDEEEPQYGYGLTPSDRRSIEALMDAWSDLRAEQRYEAADDVRMRALNAGLNLSLWAKSIDGEDAVEPSVLDMAAIQDLLGSLPKTEDL